MGDGGYPSIQGVRLRNTLGHTHHSSAPPVGTIILMCTSENVHIRMIGEKGETCKVQVWPWMGHTHYSLSPNCNLGSPITLMCTGGTFRLDRKVQVSELRFFFQKISPSKCLFNLWAMSKLWTKWRPFFPQASLIHGSNTDCIWVLIHSSGDLI